MKLKSYILAVAVALAAGSALVGCQDHFDSPYVEEPKATLQPNMTILELKQMFWNDATNFISPIGGQWVDAEGNVVDFTTNHSLEGLTFQPDDKEYIIAGRVVSSDEAGNVFKNLVIQDETAALALSINSYNLYLKYRVGQEIVIDLKKMYIGKYNGLLQLGMPEWYANGNAWEATFMAPEFFQAHIQLNGFPKAELIDTLEISAFSDIPSNPDGLMKYQSQLVKFNNIFFQNAGDQQFSEYHSSGVNQNIVDVNGSTLPVRTSGYSNFWNKYLPEGNGDLVCILSYYGSTGWQLLLNDYAGCMNFGNPTVSPGTEDNPYTVMDAIATVDNNKPASGWVTGYIVGAVAPEVTSVKSNSDVEWSSDVVLANTLVIGATPDTKDIKQSLIISLPQGTALRQYGNLADNPSNYKKEISVKGTFGYYMDSYGVLDNKGTASEFKIDGVEVGGGGAENGDGTQAKPYNVSQVIAKNPQGNGDAPDESNVWVIGYIVGWADMSSTYYINAETSRFTVPATMATNILLALTPDVVDYAQCIGVQLPSGSVRSALNLMDNPGNLGREVKILGNIAKYSGVPGLRSASAYEFVGGDTPTPDVPTGSTLYSEAFSNTQGDFIINNVTMSSALSYVWSATENYGMKASAFVNSANQDADSWLISPVFNLAQASGVKLNYDQANNKFASADDITKQCSLWVSVDGADWQQLSIGNHGDNTSWNFVNSGDIDLTAYDGKKISLGFRYTSSSASAGTWEIKNFTLTGTGSVSTSAAIIPGGGSPDPDVPTPGENSADFNSFNDGVPNSLKYATYTTANGWVADMSLILSGGTDATNFVSTSTSVLFPVLDGSAANQGKLTSPALPNGISALSFKYGFPFTETKAGFTVNILQGDAVVATKSITVDPATKATVFEFTETYSIQGQFTIQIVNDQVSGSTKSHSDRLAIWDLTWEN